MAEEEILKKFKEKVEAIKKTIIEKHGKEFLEIFEGYINEIRDELNETLGELDPECPACQHIARNALDLALTKLSNILYCLENCKDYFEELINSEEPVEPPCTSYCPVIQSTKQKSFNIAGNNEWYVKTFGHSPNCRFAKYQQL